MLNVTRLVFAFDVQTDEIFITKNAVKLDRWRDRRAIKVCVFLGTGKTLVARALANECSIGDKKVAFFMRKGADCLSKWVGESERQLRLLFDQVFGIMFCLKHIHIIYIVLTCLGVSSFMFSLRRTT